jgi:excisionase family DNA binding protein
VRVAPARAALASANSEIAQGAPGETGGTLDWAKLAADPGHRTRVIGMLSKPLLTVREAAEMLKLKEATIRNLINEKKLRAVKFGKEWRIAPKDLELFLNDNANL